MLEDIFLDCCPPLPEGVPSLKEFCERKGLDTPNYMKMCAMSESALIRKLMPKTRALVVWLLRESLVHEIGAQHELNLHSGDKKPTLSRVDASSVSVMGCLVMRHAGFPVGHAVGNVSGDYDKIVKGSYHEKQVNQLLMAIVERKEKIRPSRSQEQKMARIDAAKSMVVRSMTQGRGFWADFAKFNKEGFAPLTQFRTTVKSTGCIMAIDVGFPFPPSYLINPYGISGDDVISAYQVLDREPPKSQRTVNAQYQRRLREKRKEALKAATKTCP